MNTTADATLMELLLKHPSALCVLVIIVLEQEMANHSSILAWKIPRTGEPRGYSPWGCKESTGLSD